MAAEATAKAFVVVMRGVYGKRRRLFGVKRAESHVAGCAAGAFQAHVFADSFHDVDGRFELLDEIHAWEPGCFYGCVVRDGRFFGLRSTQARMPVLPGRCVRFVLTGFALAVGLDIAF